MRVKWNFAARAARSPAAGCAGGLAITNVPATITAAASAARRVLSRRPTAVPPGVLLQGLAVGDGRGRRQSRIWQGDLVGHRVRLVSVRPSVRVPW